MLKEQFYSRFPARNTKKPCKLGECILGWPVARGSPECWEYKCMLLYPGSHRFLEYLSSINKVLRCAKYKAMQILFFSMESFPQSRLLGQFQSHFYSIAILLNSWFEKKSLNLSSGLALSFVSFKLYSSPWKTSSS